MIQSPRSIAIASAERIRRHWRTRDDAYLFEEPEVKICPASYAIISNIVDGYPPRRLV